ncbi:sodium-dependent low-affinity dicarboxylate transporter 1-like [Haemaphysalis longicornis]
MEQRKRCLNAVQLVVAYAAPIYLLPLVVSGTMESRAAYFLLLVYACWVLNVMPAPMASSVPFVLLPLLGVMDPCRVAEYYMDEAMLFIMGVFLLALAVEGTNMYSRVALSVLGAAGAGVKAVFTSIVALSFCSTLFFKNVMSTLIVMPVVESTIVEVEHDALTSARRRRLLRKASVLARLTVQAPEQLEDVMGGSSVPLQLPSGRRESHSSLQATMLPTVDSGTSSAHNRGVFGQRRRSSVVSVDFAEKLEQETQKYILIRRVLLLSVAYATTLGAIGSVFGNPACRILRTVLEERYAYDRFSMLPWLILCLPISAAGILACWVAVFGSFLKGFDIEQDEETKESISKILEEKKKVLGNFSVLELFVLGCIILLFVIMLLRSEFVTPFALPDEFGLVSLRDTTLVFVLVFVFFNTPSQPKDKLFSDYLLEWNLVRHNVPWSAFITYGGGLCVAGAVKEFVLSAPIRGLFLGNTLMVQSTF